VANLQAGSLPRESGKLPDISSKHFPQRYD
jgi:hypothetical protein